MIDILPHIQEELDADRVASDTAEADNNADTVATGNSGNPLRSEILVTTITRAIQGLRVGSYFWATLYYWTFSDLTPLPLLAWLSSSSW